jgi:hypothetical protein
MRLDKGIGLGVVIAVGAAAAYWLYTNLQQGNSPATARAVTDTAKSGSLVTTPVLLSKVAAVAIKNPLDWVGSVTNRAAQLIPGGLSNGGVAQDWRIPFGNPESQAAAGAAPKATNVSNYRPSGWASVQFRTGV